MRNILDKCHCEGTLVPESLDATVLQHLSCNRCGAMYKASRAGLTLESLRAEQYKTGTFFPLHPRTAPCPHCTGNLFWKEPLEGQKTGIYCVACNTVRCVLTTDAELKHFDDEVQKVATAIEKNKAR